MFVFERAQFCCANVGAARLENLGGSKQTADVIGAVDSGHKTSVLERIKAKG
jgi:hypothetical protein